MEIGDRRRLKTEGPSGAKIARVGRAQFAPNA
jgi:hypothetical protein